MVTGARLNDEAATDYPGKRPQTVWGSKKIMYYNVDDGVNVADDVDDDDGGGVVDDDAADDDDDDDEGDDKGGDGDGDGDDDGDGDGDGDGDDDDDVHVHVHVHVDVDADVDVDGDVDVDVDVEEEEEEEDDDDVEEEDRSQDREAHFVRACAVEMYTNISQEAFCAEIHRENAGHFRYHLDWTPGLNTYRKSPSVWTHCLGN